jgi:hypothetical protein
MMALCHRTGRGTGFSDYGFCGACHGLLVQMSGADLVRRAVPASAAFQVTRTDETLA